MKLSSYEVRNLSQQLPRRIGLRMLEIKHDGEWKGVVMQNGFVPKKGHASKRLDACLAQMTVGAEITPSSWIIV